MPDEENYDDVQVDEVRANSNGFVLQWSSARKGFGECTFIFHGGGLLIEHEFMSREFCIALMAKLIEKYYV